MAITKVNAQGISRFLRNRGFNPSSTESLKRSPALQCRKSLDDVIVRVWSDPYSLEPSADDVAIAAEIAELLTANGYLVKYKTGSHRMIVTGKEAKTMKPKQTELAEEAGLITKDEVHAAVAPQHDQERLERLPKHAREEIIRLRDRVANLEAKLADGPADSNVFLSPHYDAVPLGKDVYLGYKTEGPEDVDGFTVQFKNGSVLVQGMAPSHDHYLGVFPMSGNYVEIRHVKKDG